jgi:hypothetical protein
MSIALTGRLRAVVQVMDAGIDRLGRPASEIEVAFEKGERRYCFAYLFLLHAADRSAPGERSSPAYRVAVGQPVSVPTPPSLEEMSQTEDP